MALNVFPVLVPVQQSTQFFKSRVYSTNITEQANQSLDPAPSRSRFQLYFEWSTMTWRNSHLGFYVSLIGLAEDRDTPHLLKCVPVVLTFSQSDWILTFFLTYRLTFLLTYLPTFFLSYLFTFFLTYLLKWYISSYISFDILSDRSFDILFDISSDILSDTYRGWGPARNTELTGSRLGSGKEH